MSKKITLAFIFLLAIIGVQAVMAQSCPSGTFSCNCNGVISCQRSIQGCWDTCLVATPGPEPVLASIFSAQPAQQQPASVLPAEITAPAETATVASGL